MEPRNRFKGMNVAWRAGPITLSSPVPSPHRLFKNSSSEQCTIGLWLYLVADVGVDHRLSVISRDAVHSLQVGFWNMECTLFLVINIKLLFTTARKMWAESSFFMKVFGTHGPSGAVRTRAGTKMLFLLSQKCETSSFWRNFTGGGGEMFRKFSR